jgi:histone H1/5
VEEKYKLEIGNAQVSQLSRAIAVGAEKAIFSLPKGRKITAISCWFRLNIFLGPSGRVKLAPKAGKAADDAKEVGL